MGTSDDLLRLLGSTVRPVGPVSPTRRANPVPFEQRGFDELLADFTQEQTSPESAPTGTSLAEDASDTPEPKRIVPLDLNRIENASLRKLIAQSHANTDAQILPT